MKWFIAVAVILISAMNLHAAEYEFASMIFKGDEVNWTDKTGSLNGPYSDFSGEAKAANPDQNRILVLNALSKKGWELVHVNDENPYQKYLFKREVTAATPTTQPAKAQSGDQIPLIFTGGYETDHRDGGRPVVLVAAGLNVPSDIFRQAFSHVKPAGPGEEPQDAQVRKNKQALMEALQPYGVTNEKLDEVSNYYRYSGSRGQMWKHRPAVAHATVSNGVVTAITVTDPGAGYSSPPTISISGMPGVTATAELSFTSDLTKNGSIKEIKLTKP
jgi:hypothetical protein